ncbi:MAG TPA: SAM-dependent methyltransferase, partial [Ottowia sp.]|nr:SAM-dependent methyltransferase [Ottowia sp.]
ELTAIMTPYEGDAPRFYKGDWRLPFEAPGQRWFGPLQETRWPYVHRGTPQDVVVNRTMSVSFIAALPKPEQARVRERIEALIARHPALRGQALVDSPYTTQAYAAEKLA